MESLTQKQKIILAIAGIFVVVLFAIYMNTKSNSNTYTIANENDIEEKEEIQETNISEENTEEKIYIHITGAVMKEGVVEINNNARIKDAIEMAGGLREDADISNVNLAYILKDGQKIYIPNKSEIVQAETIVTEENGEEVIIDDGGDLEEINGKININTAGIEQLEKLSGIGEGTAIKIIEYRKDNGKFKSIEDLKNVSGIGDAKFNSIKNNICVD